PAPIFALKAVPVYGLFPGGDRPAYAMRFVEGQTLAEAIAAYHAGPPEQVAFRRLLQAFLQVCQTVFQPDPPPAAEPLGRVREYHPLHCRTPWSRTSTFAAADRRAALIGRTEAS